MLKPVIVVLALFCATLTVHAQDFVPIEISLPYAESGVNSNGSMQSISGTGGSCHTVACCSVLVYKFTLPLRGSVRLEMDPFTPLSMSPLGYTSSVPNASNWSDLETYSAPGNFCGFRDSMLVGRGYNWVTQEWVSDTNTVFEPTCPAGDWYVCLFNNNQQTGSGGSTNLTIDYRPYCPDGFTCGTVDAVVCDGSAYSSPAGNQYDSTGTYVDTLAGQGVGGVDSLLFVNLTIETFAQYTDTSNTDTTLACGSNFDAMAATEFVGVGTFDNSNNDFVVVDDLADSLANSSRSVFMWARTSAAISGSADMLFAINSSSGGNVCNLQLGTNEKVEVYHGSGTQSATSTVTNDGWHFVGYTYDNATTETNIWVDGVLEKTFNNDQTVVATDLVSIGQEYDSGPSPGNYFDGDMAEVSIWTEVLDAAAVAALMEKAPNSTHPNYSDLLAYYPFGGTDCPQNVNRLEDFSGNGYHGTTTGSTIVGSAPLEAIAGYNAAPGYTVAWNSSGSGSLGTNQNITITPADAGTIELTLTRTQIEIAANFEVNSGLDLSVAETGGTTLQSNQSGAIYQWLDCDNAYAQLGGETDSVLTGLTGNFAVEVTFGGCTDTSACFMISSGSCGSLASFDAVLVQDVTARIIWDTVPGATGYRVWYKPQGTNGWTRVTKNGQQGKKDLTGLSNLTKYKYMMQARCASVWGPLTAEQSFTTLDAPCGAVNPATMTTAPVQLDQARINWDVVPGIHKYKIRYRTVGNPTWTTVFQDTLRNHRWLTGLATGTMYEWQMSTLCKSKSTTTTTAWTPSKTFTTNASKTDGFARVISPAAPMMTVFPNPASDYVNVGLAQHQSRADVLLVDLRGKIVYQTWYPASQGPEMQTIETSHLAAGIYILMLTADGQTDRVRLVVQ